VSFWLFAIAIPSLAAVALCWPMLRQRGAWLVSGISLLLLIPVTTLLLYQGVGAPEGIGAARSTASMEANSADVETLLAQLRARLAENPDNLEGWMLLGRSLKSMQRYTEAREALRRAQALAADDPLVQVELAEALIFSSSQAEGIAPEVRELLESALATEPDLQKALWLMGVTEFQDGNFEAAIARWETLLRLLPPGSGVAGSVQKQLAEARSRAGLADLPPPAAAPSNAWPGLELTVSAPSTVTPPPDGAVLYIIARDPDAPAPPLGVVRVPRPVFPVTVRLDDSNSMLPARPVSGVNRVEVLARLSLSGEPLPGPDDPASAPRIFDTAPEQPPIELTLAPPE